MTKRYASSRDAAWPFKWIARVLLKLMWSIGGTADRTVMPRLWGEDIQPHLSLLEAGDLLLLGNAGVASHCAVYVGEGTIVHSMATEKTMRGWSGSLWDLFKRPFRWLVGTLDKTGVIEEPLAEFLDRFERDTWLAVRSSALSAANSQTGIAHIRGLVGQAYDYDFSAGDDEYYCTEIVIEFLGAALDDDARPELETRKVRVPGVLDTWVVEPVALLGADGLEVVAANAAAQHHYEEHLQDAHIVT